MIATYRYVNLLIIILYFSVNCLVAQENAKISLPKTEFYDLRGTNAFDAALGTSVINGDLSDPEFEIYSHFGYKRHLTPHFAIDFGYHKFNLAFKDQFNEGFMSFDLNLEVLLAPHNRFSPYIFGGAGYNASNRFSQSDFKIQGGLGLEYVVSNQFALKVYTDYNAVSSDTLDGLEAGESNDTYFRIAFGVNYYFGGAKAKAKRLQDYETEIETNPVTDDKNNLKL